MVSKNKDITFRDALTGLAGSAKYHLYDVQVGTETVTVKTNLSEDDLNKYFPQPAARQAWLRSIAQQSTLPRKARR